VYEILTGKRAFDGTNLAETLSRVVDAEPDFTALPTDVPPMLRDELTLYML